MAHESTFKLETSDVAYVESVTEQVEGALSEAVFAAVQARSEDPLGTIILHLLKLRGGIVDDAVEMPLVARPSRTPLSVLTIMDPGQDLDDEMYLVLLRALTNEHLVNCLGVVTTLEPPMMRAQLARGTLDLLGLRNVPVGAGSDGNATGSTSMFEGVSYMVPSHFVDQGVPLMVRQLKEMADRSVTLIIIASLKDAAQLLRHHEQLCLAKIKEVVIQGGVKPFEPGIASGGQLLQPDSAHNNEFDSEASAFVYERCQQIGIPLLIVSRFAAGVCQVPRSIYDRMAETGSPIGLHLQQSQSASIERLWRQACAPLGSEIRGSLPSRCDKAWFCSTFCGGAGQDRDGTSSIWDLIVNFNMYDPLALLAALPSFSSRFAFSSLIVNGTEHRVVGISKENPGVNADQRAGLTDTMCKYFLEGIQSEERDKMRALSDVRIASATIVDLRRENAELKARLAKK